MIVLVGEIRNTGVDSAFPQQLRKSIPGLIIRFFRGLAIIAVTEICDHSTSSLVILASSFLL